MQQLHFIPDHAAASQMLGLVHARRGLLDDSIPLMERAVKRCPWKAE